MKWCNPTSSLNRLSPNTSHKDNPRFVPVSEVAHQVMVCDVLITLAEWLKCSSPERLLFFAFFAYLYLFWKLVNLQKNTPLWFLIWSQAAWSFILFQITINHHNNVRHNHIFIWNIIFTASAESYLNECLATYQSLHGPNHEKTIQCQDELSRLMIRTERPDEAIEVCMETENMSSYVINQFLRKIIL